MKKASNNKIKRILKTWILDFQAANDHYAVKKINNIITKIKKNERITLGDIDILLSFIFEEVPTHIPYSEQINNERKIVRTWMNLPSKEELEHFNNPFLIVTKN